MKMSFPTLLGREQNGLIAIPILIVAILGSLVVGGGGYAVYKYNEIVEEKKVVEIQLNEHKDKEIQRLQEQVNLFQESKGTTTEENSDTEKPFEVSDNRVEPVITTPSKVKVVPVMAPPVTTVVTEAISPVQTEEKLITDKVWAQDAIDQLTSLIETSQEKIDDSNKMIEYTALRMAKFPGYYAVQTTGENVISNERKLLAVLTTKKEILTKMLSLHQSVIKGASVKESELMSLMKEDTTSEDMKLYYSLRDTLFDEFGKAQGDALDAQADALQKEIDRF